MIKAHGMILLWAQWASGKRDEFKLEKRWLVQKSNSPTPQSDPTQIGDPDLEKSLQESGGSLIQGIKPDHVFAAYIDVERALTRVAFNNDEQRGAFRALMLMRYGDIPKINNLLWEERKLVVGDYRRWERKIEVSIRKSLIAKTRWAA